VIVPRKLAIVWDYINKIVVLHNSLQLNSAGIKREAASSFLIGVEYKVEVSTKYNIIAFFFINIFFKGRPTLLFVSIKVWSIDVIDNYYLTICCAF